ncbi:MAG: pilus assembly protein PilE, partial [Gammaproteobacteria bacterium]|nr:pilus assembly protein PilE [Gammaproteobacteria bacterium]
IAVPSYNNYVLRAKRSEGRAALMDVAALQERYYSDCNIYGTLNGPRACGTSRSGITNTQSETGKYNVTLTTMGANNQSYVLTATPTFDDPGCGNLTMTQAGTKNKVGGTDTVNNCWGK